MYNPVIFLMVLSSINDKYIEGAHIRPIGEPHNGDDNRDNIICLCPNHHIMFDKGGFSINDDFSLVGHIKGKLNVIKGHDLELKNLEYHRKWHGYGQ